MRAIVCDRYGPADVLRLEDVPLPTLADDQVLVRVRAASVNSWDAELLRGTPLVNRLPHVRRPRHRVLGTDIAGHVERVGRDVTRWRPGDEVLGDLSGCGWGAFAEYARAAPEALVTKPPELSFEAAAAAPQAGLLALAGLRYRGPVGPGERVLVNGAGGGVGTFAVQMAKAAGAEVTGVDSAAKLDLLSEIGADHVVDRDADVTAAGEQYDRVLDVAAHRSMLDWRRALTSTGSYAVVGGASSRILQAVVVGAWAKATSSQSMGLVVYTKPTPADLETLADLLGSARVVPVIDRVLPLADTADAVRLLAAGELRGKAVIDCR